VVARRALLVLLLLGHAACFERGRGRPADDAGAAAAIREAAPAAPASAHVEPAGPADPDATIGVALEVEPATLDPLRGAEQVTQRIARGGLFEGLLAPGPRLGDPPRPELAARWTVDDGGRRWTFTLVPARWHDGAPVTAADVAATLEAARTSWLGGALDDLAGIDTPAPDTVVVRFTGARADRRALFEVLPILPGGQVDGARPIGSGPLRFVRWTRGQAIELARADGYHGAPAGAARVIHRVAADRAHALRMLAAGEVDVVVQVPADEAARFAGAHRDAGTFGYRMPAFLAAVFNARRPALAEVDARRALTALLDRPGLAARLFASPPLTGPFPAGAPGHDPTVTPVPFDRALAARLLGGARLRVEVLVPQGSPTMARIADVWAADARGVAELVVVATPFGELVGRLASGDFDVALTSLTTGAEHDFWSRLSSRAPRQEAWTGLADAELDRLLDAVRGELDDGRRAGLRRALHRRIAELAPLAFIAPDVRAGLARRDVGGLAGAPEGGPPAAARLWRSRRR
jgi:peptide/nickel transport system substrate-binding protein